MPYKCWDLQSCQQVWGERGNAVLVISTSSWQWNVCLIFCRKTLVPNDKGKNSSCRMSVRKQLVVSWNQELFQPPMG